MPWLRQISIDEADGDVRVDMQKHALRGRKACHLHIQNVKLSVTVNENGHLDTA